MFEDVISLWRQYCDKHAPSWASDDPRHDLSAEVRDRLAQLDIVLEYLKTALAVFAGDPTETRRQLKWMMEAKSRLDAGQITEEEYLAGVSCPKSPEELGAFVRAGAEIRLFTETFYFVAWRLREVLRRGGTLAFPGFSNFDALGVRSVRNQLMEHPERSDSRNFRQHLVVTDAGPVLKSSTMVIRAATGRAEPDSDSVDRGLFVTAQEFHDELLQRVRKELASAP